MNDLFLGVDVGTTGTKSVVADVDGAAFGKGYYGYPLITPFEGASEQDPNEWYKGTIESVRTAIKGINSDRIKAVSFSAQGGSFFVAEKREETFFPLTDALTWMDVRANEQFVRVSKIISPDEFYKITGWRLSPSSMFCRLLWLKENEPDVFNRADAFFTTSDYVHYKFTGKRVIDYTSAALTGLFDIKEKKWSRKLIDIVGISENQLPLLMNAGEKIGTIKADVAEEAGLNNSATVVCGIHDQYALSIASGAVRENDVFISAGTTWVAFGISRELCFSKGYLSPCPHPFGGYGVIGSAVSSGTIMEWLRKQFSVSFEEIEEQTKKRKPDRNLFVYPFLTGCGDYRQEKNVRASVIGLSLGHDRFDVIRAAMEGVAFEIKTLLKEFETAGVNGGKITIAGGGAKNGTWVEILAAVLGSEIFVLSEKDICAAGAAALSSGNHSAKSLTCKVIVPDKRLVEFYEEKYSRYNATVERATIIE